MRSRSLRTILALPLIAVVLFASIAHGDTWDMHADFDYTSNPNGPWSYRDGGNDSLLTLDEDIWEWSIPAWVGAQGEASPPWLWHDPYYQPVSVNSVGGHGPILVIWVSPITGTIDLTGFVFQDHAQPTRALHWTLSKNGQVFTEGDTTPDLTIYDLATGTGGLAAMSLQVNTNDLIEFREVGGGTGATSQYDDFFGFNLRIVDSTASLSGTLTLRNVNLNTLYVCDNNYNPVVSYSSSGNLFLNHYPYEPLLFSVNVTVSGFGTLNFTAANGGDGYMPEGQTLDVLYEVARHRYISANAILVDAQSEGFNFPSEVSTQMTIAQSYLDQAANSTPGSLQQANYALQSLQYSCPASETIVTELGRQKLDRQGGLRPDQWVSIFGVYESREAQQWRDAMSPLFNACVTYWSWQWQWESEGIWTMPFMGQEGTVSRMSQIDKKNRAHALFWMWDVPPVHDGQAPFTPVTLQHLIDSHANYAGQMASDYPEISNWVLANECHSWDDLDWLEPEDVAQIIKAVGQEIEQVDPDSIKGVVTTVMWGEDAVNHIYGSPRVVAPYEFAEILIDADVPYEYIGMQLYSGHDRDLFEVHEMLERYSRLGKRIRVCEMQSPSQSTSQPGNTFFPSGIPGNWHRNWDEALQADWLEGMFLVCLSKNYVDEWNWWDLADYAGNYYPWGGLMDSNYVPKESYYRLQELMQLWGYEKPPCMVNLNDLVSLAGDWLGGPGLPGNLNNDSGVDLRDYAVLGEHWQELCPQLDFYTELEVWDLVNDWSDVVNPNSPWTYGGFTPFYSFYVIATHQDTWKPVELGPNQPAWADTAEAASGWCKSVGASSMDFPLGRVGHRGEVILRWTSPVSGLIRITGGLWQMRDSGYSQSWMLRRNATSFTSGALTAGPSSSNPLGFAVGSGGLNALTLTVLVGDIIDLYLYEAGPGGDYTGVDLTIAHIVENFKDWPWSDPIP